MSHYFLAWLWLLPTFRFRHLQKATLRCKIFNTYGFFLQCVLIGVVEELFFRGIVQDVVWKKTHKLSIWHLVNLMFGQGFATTLLQVGYSFLIGAMLTTLRLVTNNIWLCVLVHALFDFGGNIVNALGSGEVWDVPFWIATVVCGVSCAVWVVAMLVKSDKNKAVLQPENIRSCGSDEQ